MTSPQTGTTPPAKTSRWVLIWRLMAGQRLRYGMAIGALVLGSGIPLPGAAGAPGGAGRHPRR